jgi:hypothetical protein
VEPSEVSGESLERYRRELRDLMVAGIDFRRVPASPRPTRNTLLQSDLVRVAEHYSDLHLQSLAPASFFAFGLWAAIAEDICVSLEDGDRLQPSAWAVGVAFRWWFEKSRIERAWLRLWGHRAPRPGGRPLYEFIRA